MRTLAFLVACLSCTSSRGSTQLSRQRNRASDGLKQLHLTRILLALSPTVGGRISHTRLAPSRVPNSLKIYHSDRLREPTMRLSRNQVSDFQRTLAGTAAGLFLMTSTLFGLGEPALGMTPAETANVGTCLITKAPLPLARCVTDPTCLANLVCIQTCTGKPDEGDCQVKCGDEFSNDVVGAFTKAAVSDTGCVPQRPDDGSYPVPQSSALVQKFNTEDMIGDWYISAGYNPAFDIFDCQLHKFSVPAPGKLKGDLQWRIKDPLAGTQFVTRRTVQEFVQDEKEPGILYNHDNEFLHYQDDWYVLAQKSREYVLIYYRGNNDAWDGYGGAVVYTTKPTLEKRYYGELDEALRKVGLKFEDFKLTDNSCKPRESRLQELENDFVFVESKAATGLQMVEKAVEKEAVLIEQEMVKDATNLEKKVESEVVRDVTNIEKEIEKDTSKVFPFLR